MSIFKAYDIRGVYPSQINEEIAYKIGKSFVTFTKTKQVVVGIDARISSPQIFDSLVKGLTEQGADVINIGLVTTPMFNFVQAHFKYISGIMITASHNPKEYNGLKMNSEDATPLTEETGIKEIEKLVEENNFVEVLDKGSVSKKNHFEDYFSFIVDLVKKDISKLKIVVDASSGSIGPICKQVFSKLNVNYVPLNFEPNGDFPSHDPNPLKKDSQEETKKVVLKEKADFGCLFDADADRIIFIDEYGKTIQSDFVAALITKKVLRDKPGGKVLYDCISSRIIEKTIVDNGGVPIVTRVGRSYIYLTAKKEDVLFGAEASSHYYHQEVYHSDNGLLTLLKIMELLIEEKKSLSMLVEPYKIYAHSGEVNVGVEGKDEKIKLIAEEFKDGKQSRLDGISVEYDNAWFNVRKSNTEPLLRVRIEGKNKESVDDMKRRILEIIA
ncbi:phosphomannomutase/phosphoglucomutase [Candidatus Woesearchaeota archaeon]|jgi:phosphomannomutase|nr:phosphomannomutase/phosphoglucomutase [Candidatus Woesearchaeota archaeon]|tara:strand:+ start:749 stop:2071 length:1323 start_codon:yes stop_codon:yes gene_type:complete